MEVCKLISCILFLVVTADSSSRQCLKKRYGKGANVCVCNKEFCDTIGEIPKVDNNTYVTYTSDQHGVRFKRTIVTNINFTYNYWPDKIFIDSSKSFQEIQGFGGAFTDATALNILSLEEELQDEIMRAYFSKDGIEYNMGRVPMGATDFSTHPYSYQDEEDITLSNFTLAPEDYDMKIPLIKKALNYSDYELDLFTSTWTAPKWMKTNGNYSGMGGRIKDELYQTWADYFLKFLDEYKKENITFWGLTTGNEPSLALTSSKIPSVLWGTKQMRNFVSKYLGPTIRNSSHSDIKLMLLDDQRWLLPWYASEVFEDEDAKNYIDGIAVHWYGDFVVPAAALQETHDDYPDKFILATEACTGVNQIEPVELGSWNRAEQYVDSIIEDVNHMAVGWIDWNMVLDLGGGPTFIDNYVDAPIIINASAGEFYKQPSYHALGHFSKFVPRGSVRVFSVPPDSDVSVAAFRRPDDRIAVIILNKKDNAYPVVLADYRIGQLEMELPGKSITTVLYYFVYSVSASITIQPNTLLILLYSVLYLLCI